MVRRRLSAGTTKHTKRLKVDESEAMRWNQTFTRGRVEQAFRHVCLRRRLMTLPSYAHLRMRGHAVVADTGRSAVARHIPKADSPSIRRNMKEVMEAYRAP